ncbi:MAG: xanthine dehydrogenase family protein molybdopterin-binding subunit, partial [Solirubrobacteraceae bacterium]
GADRLRVDYAPEPHDVLLRPDHPGFYAPDIVNGNYETDSVLGDPDAALSDAAVVVDETYTTPPLHNNAMEPHASVAQWVDDRLVVNDSSQGAWPERATLAQVFGLEPEQVRVVSPHVCGGFGSKGTARPQVVVVALAAKALGRPVKIAMTRQQMFSTTGYRTPTVQRVRLGAGADGRIAAVSHEALSQSSTVKEFTEQTATVARVMYGGEHRRSTHRLTRLDVPTPSWMRAPGECPGMFALESAMDELAIACRIDPVELRIRNDPPEHPESGKAWSSRNLVACLREGAERFGWEGRDPTPRARRQGRGLIGTGVATSMYPTSRAPGWAVARREADGSVTVRIAAADIGTGARTALTQIAADALGVGADRVRVELGDSDFPRAGVAGGSMGTASWGSAVHGACRKLVEGAGDVAEHDTREELSDLADYARHAFGAQFMEVRVDADTGEVRVQRALGIFAAGRIINPRTARSQFLGGMTMGIGMALMEESVVDLEFGDFVNHDLAQYHVPTNADIREIEAFWVGEDDPHLNPMGSKGIGEIGITGAAAAVANAVHHATGVRVRDLPLHLEDLL